MFVAALLPASGISARTAEGEPSEKAAAGHLELDSCSFDFGTISADSVAEGAMHFRNEGNAPLQILSIFSECGCTTSSYTANPVEPGGEGEIRIRFNGKNRSPGPFRKALRIRSNADNPRVVLFVKGLIK